MKILSLGLDNSILNEESSLAKRTAEYGSLVDRYIIIVPAKENDNRKISSNVEAYGVRVSNKFIGFFKILKLAKELIKKEKFNVITAQDQYFLGFLAWCLAKKFNLGLEIQVHGFEKYYCLRKVIAKFVIPRADSIRTVSRRLKKQLVRDFGISKDKITVVSIYVKTQEESLRRKISKSDNFVFLTVARLVPVKNIEMQIRAMKKIGESHPDTELWIVGDGPARKKLEKLAGGNECIKFFGWQDNLDRFYGGADAFLLSSNYEGWGMSIIEAASFGLPIIMTDVGCAGEVIKYEESGLIIPVGDLNALESAMIKLILNGDLRDELGLGAKKAVSALLSKEETMKLYKESWEKALN